MNESDPIALAHRAIEHPEDYVYATLKAQQDIKVLAQAVVKLHEELTRARTDA